MSRPRVNSEEVARAAFLREIKVKRAMYDIRQRDIADELGLAPCTMSSLLSRPDDISIGRLRKIIAMLHLDPMIVMAFLGYSPKELKQLMDK